MNITDKMNKVLEFVKENPVKHVIGLAKTPTVFSYCLMSRQANNTRVLLVNSRFDEKEFDEEVANLAKYFNAEILTEV